MEGIGADLDYLWNRIYDLIIKTTLSIEPIVVDAVRQLALHRNNCFDLFGFDILVDSKFKPWLLEVNLSPSLATESPLDLHLKGQLVADTLNLIGVRLFDRKKENMKKVGRRVQARHQRLFQKTAHTLTQFSRREKEVTSRGLIRTIVLDALEEYDRRGRYLRIYPSQGTDYYDQYFPIVRASNKALYMTMIRNLFLKGSGFFSPRTLSPIMQETSFTSQSFLEDSSRKCSNSLEEKSSCEKVVVTGEDALLEYLKRIIKTLRKTDEESVRNIVKRSLCKFITHHYWHKLDDYSLTIWARLKLRLDELTEKQQKTRSRTSNRRVVHGLSTEQLEGMLTNYKKAGSQVTAYLISTDGKGVLSELNSN